MEENLKKVLEYVAFKLNDGSLSINPTLIEFLNKMLSKHSPDDIMNAINVSIQEAKTKRKFAVKNLMKLIEENVGYLSNSKQEDQLIDQDFNSYPPTQEGPLQEKKHPKNSHISLSEKWNMVFQRHKIPKSLINKRELSEIPHDLKDFYISKKVVEYIYQNLPQKDRDNLEKYVNYRMKKLYLHSDTQEQEARRYTIAYYIKKNYHIPY